MAFKHFKIPLKVYSDHRRSVNETKYPDVFNSIIYELSLLKLTMSYSGYQNITQLNKLKTSSLEVKKTKQATNNNKTFS